MIYVVFSQTQGNIFGGPYNKDSRILEYILGYPDFGKLRCGTTCVERVSQQPSHLALFGFLSDLAWHMVALPPIRTWLAAPSPKAMANGSGSDSCSPVHMQQVTDVL